MKKKCILTKGYALTEGSEYDVIKEEKGYIFIVNDNGKTARYVSELFENEVAAPLPPPVPEPIVLTEAQCIASINAGVTQFRNTDNEIIQLNSPNLSWEESSISCGIYEAQGINDLIHTIHDEVPDSDDDRISLKKAILKNKILRQLSQNTGYAIALLSTNLNVDEDLIEAIDEIAHFKSDGVVNPNSQNTIKLWGFYKNQL